MTTHEAALADYMKYKTGQAGDAADPPTGRPAPDAAHQAALEHASRLLVPSYRLEQQQRAAEAEAERRRLRLRDPLANHLGQKQLRDRPRKNLKSETGHGTQKPVECMRRPIENNASPGQAVYEPFSGSGTTIPAAYRAGA